jgi:tRNA U34 2-thiouridine synthase MnmA/TrmU
MAKEDVKERRVKEQAQVDGPNPCIHCNEEPSIFLQIELPLCENDDIY